MLTSIDSYRLSNNTKVNSTNDTFQISFRDHYEKTEFPVDYERNYLFLFTMNELKTIQYVS